MSVYASMLCLFDRVPQFLLNTQLCDHWLNQERESANGHSRAGSRVVTKRWSRIGISPTHSYMEGYHEGH
jgi:hypothetical protein